MCKQISIFIIVGLITTIIDYVSYRGFYYVLSSVLIAKVIGFFAGASFAFFANKKITFECKVVGQNFRVKFLMVYLISLIMNTSVNLWVIENYSYSAYAIQVAFICATAVSATFNFLGMKYYVFCKKGERFL